MFTRQQRLRTFAEPIDDFGADETFLQNVIAPSPAPAPVAAPAPAPAPASAAPQNWQEALQQQNPNWILQAIQSQPASLETGESAGPIEGYTFYDPSKTSTNDTFKRYDTSGNLLGEQQFKKPGNILDLTSSAAADLGPILQYTPLAPAVAGINALTAAQQGNVLPLISSAAGLGGYSEIANAAKAAEAIRKEDYLGAVLPALQAAGIKDVGGYGQEDIGKAVNVARAIEQENPLALAGAASAYLPGPSMPGLFVDENIQEGFFEPGGPGYIEPTSAPTSYFPEFDQPLLTADPTDWAALYAQPTTDPVTGQTIVGADQAGYPVQDFGVEPQSDINEVYNRIANDMGGFASTWQTVGSDRVMVQDDGSAIGINTETNQSYSLTPEETQRMVDAGLLNTAASGYEAAIRGTPSAPAASAAPPAAPAPAPAAKKKEDDLALLMMLSAMMTPQQKEEEQYQVAQILGIKDPFGRIV